MIKSIEKILTKNDTAETGGHQAGITIPKKGPFLQFFPELNSSKFNPDLWITCIDPKGTSWKMRFVYYNGKILSPPKSTRNEYRVTHMTSFFKEWGAISGDSVVFETTGEPHTYKIRVEPLSDNRELTEPAPDSDRPKIIKLRGWKAVY